jgi:hypothetical protein
MNVRRLIAMIVVCGALTAAESPAQSPTTAVPAESRRFALLVGCTKYSALGPKYALEGPANDVALLDRLLRDRFRFVDGDITRLLHANPVEGRPNYANIVRELERLVANVRRDDEVFILLSGHGSQQPDQRAAKDGVAGDEDDGLDEVFLPEDAGEPIAKPNGADAAAVVARTPGIADDQLEAWLTGLVDRGARVFFVVDTCHSGTMSRAGNDDDDGTFRFVPPEVLATPEELNTAKAAAVAGRGQTTANSQAKHDADSQNDTSTAKARGTLTSFYAVPPHALEREQPMPPDGGSSADRRYGRLCYAVNQVLVQTPTTLTYRELAAHVSRQYRSWSWFPQPVLEASALDREVLGSREWPERAALRLTHTADGALELDQGLAHGLTVGSVVRTVVDTEVNLVAVASHLRVTSATPLAARVEPTTFGDAPAIAAEKVVAPSRCEIVEIDRGRMQLAVRVSPLDEKQLGTPATSQVAEVRKLIEDLATRKDSVVRAAVDGAIADVTLLVGEEQVALRRRGDLDEEATGAQESGGRKSALFGPYSIDDGLRAALVRDLRRIALVTNLFRLAEIQEPKNPLRAKTPFGLAVEVERLPADEEKWSPLDFTSPRFKAGDTLRIRVRNIGSAPLDATVLYVDSSLSIASHYPTLRAARAGTYNTIESRGSREVTIKINDSTVGWEDVLVFAVLHQPPISAHFAFLEQPGLTRADLRTLRGDANSPLDDLLSSSLGGTRAATRQDTPPRFAIRRIPLEVVGSTAASPSRSN